MKILLISNGYPPHRWAGTETLTAGIAEELLSRDHQVQVLCTGEWETGAHYWNGFEDDLHHGVPVRRLNLNWKKSPDPFGYLYNNPIVANFLKQYLEQIQPDLVHVTSCETLSASVVYVTKELNLPLVLSLTDFWFLCPQINLLRSDGTNCDGLTTEWECLRCKLFGSKAYQLAGFVLPESVLEPLFLSISKHPVLTRKRGLRGMAGDMSERKSFLCQALDWPDVRITASKFVQEVFISNGIQVPIRIQPYGHDLSWLKSYHGKTQSELIRIGFIGQIVQSKGVHLLLQAASSLQNRVGDKFSLSIYGNIDQNADYSAELRNLASNIINIQFCGTYSHNQSADVYANIDVLVVPSLWYDFPLIIYEAFATQTPVITSNIGGMAEAVAHNSNGLLFERGDITDLSEQLKRVVEEPGLLDRLRIGIPHVKTIKENVDELEAIYMSLVENRTIDLIV